MNVTVFCSMRDVAPEYMDAASDLATRIARGGHTLVWGGSNLGMMKGIADAAQNAGGKIVGISMEFFQDKARPNADEMIVVATLAERKALLLARADAIIALPGGFGTLDEITEVIELKKQGAHKKPIVALNTNGFYDGLKTQLERMEKEGFFFDTLANYVYFASTPEDTMEYLKSYDG